MSDKKFISVFILWMMGLAVVRGADKTEVDKVLELHGNRGGFAVYIGDDNDTLVRQLSEQSMCSVHGLFTDRTRIETTRRHLSNAGLYGRCSVEHWSGVELPYIENLVSLLICEDKGAVSKEEILRVLSPNGLALFRSKTGWEQLRKPANPNTDEWPQYYYGPENNPVSKDTLVAPPRHLQWRGSPRWGRFHEKMSSFAATDNFIYVTLGIKAPITKLDARTGRVVKTYAGTEYTDEIILSDKMLIAVVRPELPIPSFKDGLTIKGMPTRFQFSQEQKTQLKVLDPESGKLIWQMGTAIAPLGVALDSEHLYICDFAKIRCFDKVTGKSKWDSRPLPVLITYPSSNGPRMVVKDGVVLFTGSVHKMKGVGCAGRHPYSPVGGNREGALEGRPSRIRISQP